MLKVEEEKVSTSVGFEPTPTKWNRFLICRLNHSAMTSMIIQLLLMHRRRCGSYVGGVPRLSGSALPGNVHVHVVTLPGLYVYSPFIRNSFLNIDAFIIGEILLDSNLK